ncbi:MAG: hypothetical protein OXD01_02945 [Gammaproteobacteria bacterium]|nr:hypothetical protein [Gammaproteobacteria bacterium]
MPNVVKGSKQHRMVVMPHRPRRQFFLKAAVLIMVLANVWSGWFWINNRDLQNQDLAQAERAGLIAENKVLQQENAELKRQIAILDRGSMMDQHANEEVQGTIRTLRNRVAALEQDVVYYRQVISEETEDTGLVVGALDIGTTVEPDHYRYKLVMRQENADGDTFLNGHVNVNLIGMQDEEQVVYPLREVSKDVDQLDIRLRFKYFQNIEGELALPDGFAPDRIQIAAMSVEPVEKTINQDFNWAIQSN